MKIVIKGQNYNFCVVASGTKFYIEVLHFASLRCSFINNLNTILSQFNIGVDDKRASESQWLISKKQSNLIFKKAIMVLSDRSNRDYIEKRLDEDRECGEWENFHKTKAIYPLCPTSGK
ncbi:MAG: hypothetical protein WAP52_02610 [Candidatus Sungiibacteriota bacterium]